MNKRILILATMALFSAISMMAQDDDMYFTGKKHQKRDASTMRSVVTQVEDDTTPTYYCGSMRSVDEYNRRGRYRQFSDSLNYEPDSILVSRQDYENAMKLKRFDGYHSNVLIINDPWYYDPWYYDSWYWHTRWYDPWYDPWYTPYHYGWYSSWGWGGWYRPYHWGGWYGPTYWGHTSTWTRGGSSRYVPNNGRYATARREYGNTNRQSSSRNATTQRGNSFANRTTTRSYDNTPTRTYTNPTTSRSNSFSSSSAGSVTRGSSFSGGSMSRGGGGAGISRGGGFSGGGHGGRR